MALLRSKKQSPEPAPRAAAERTAGAVQAGESLIGHGMVLKGDCRTDGALRIDGHVRGSVEARRLHVSPTGRVDGDVTGKGSGKEQDVVIEGRVGGSVSAPWVAIGPQGSVGGGLNVQEALIRGRVTGSITDASRLLIEETAVVDGDVTARRLGLKEGGQVSGLIRIGESPPKPTGGETGKSGPSS